MNNQGKNKETLQGDKLTQAIQKVNLNKASEELRNMVTGLRRLAAELNGQSNQQAA